MKRVEDCKQELEDMESSLDSIFSVMYDTIGQFRNTDELSSLYFIFRDKLQDDIKSIFPKGTKFVNF